VFQPIDVGFLVATETKKKESIDLSQKIDTMQDMQDKLKKI
jgi:hypothetical protein